MREAMGVQNGPHKKAENISLGCSILSDGKNKKVQLYIIVVKLIITLAGGISLPAIILLIGKEAKHIWEIIITIRRIGKTIGEIILRL